MTDQENIALIELGGSHDECLYSQVLFLKKYGYRVHIILFSDHLARIEKWEEVDAWQAYSMGTGILGQWKLVFKVRSYLRRNKIRNAIINTAEGNIIRKLSLIPGRGVRFAGLIHLSRKLWTSRSQRIISRKIKKYFVLADFISENLDQADPAIKIQYFYPVYFPNIRDRLNSNMEPLDSNPEEFLVTIPGAVDFARRDYSALMDELSSFGIPDGIRFILLGRASSPDGRNLVARILEEKLEDHFRWFEGFVETRQFYTCLSRSSLILPLITPGSYDYEDYLRYKITGTYNLAWGFHIPMLMHNSFSNYPVFHQTSAFYQTGQILKALSELDPERLESLKKGIAKMKDFDFDFQAEKYMNFIKD